VLAKVGMEKVIQMTFTGLKRKNQEYERAKLLFCLNFFKMGFEDNVTN